MVPMQTCPLVVPALIAVLALAACGSKDSSSPNQDGERPRTEIFGPADPKLPDPGPPTKKTSTPAPRGSDASGGDDSGGGGGAPVPEPATLLLVGTGLLGAALYRRRSDRPQP